MRNKKQQNIKLCIQFFSSFLNIHPSIPFIYLNLRLYCVSSSAMVADGDGKWRRNRKGGNNVGKLYRNNNPYRLSGRIAEPNPFSILTNYILVCFFVPLTRRNWICIMTNKEIISRVDIFLIRFRPDVST